MNEVWCTNCEDPFDPVEYNVANFSGDNFCSDRCADQFEFSTLYDEGRYGGAPAI